MKRIFFSSLLLLLIVTSLTAFSQNRKNKHLVSKPPKNIILMIGDGMGTTQLYAGYTAKNGIMNITGMPVSGFVTTFSADNYITDSGAAGTAFATGTKTKNSSIGVDTMGMPVKSILELAEENGLSSGLVSTSAITHATPASFIAHTSNRSKYDDIAFDFLKTDIDVFIGGGYNDFARRADSLNLIDSLEVRGYLIARDLKSIRTPLPQRLAALLADKHMPAMSDGRGNMLPDASGIALSILDRNQKGFFLMIEGSQIDWGGHDNNSQYLVNEVVDFDNAVGKVLQFAKNDGETLVIVTADHETGGYVITNGNIAQGIVEGKFELKDHSPVMTPLFAFGPGSELFMGVQDNTDIFKKCVKLFGFKIEK